MGEIARGAAPQTLAGGLSTEEYYQISQDLARLDAFSVRRSSGGRVVALISYKLTQSFGGSSAATCRSVQHRSFEFPFYDELFEVTRNLTSCFAFVST